MPLAFMQEDFLVNYAFSVNIERLPQANAIQKEVLHKKIHPTQNPTQQPN